MASGNTLTLTASVFLIPYVDVVKIPKPKAGSQNDEQREQPSASGLGVVLPQTLVRIPIDDQQVEKEGIR